MSVVLVAFPTTDAEVILDAYDVRVTADGGTDEPTARPCVLSALADLLGESLGMEVDTESDVDIALTLSVQDIQDPTKRRGAFSKTITLPGTANNHVLFGHAYNLQSYFGGFNPTRRIRASLWVDGIQVFTGIMQLLGIKKSGSLVNYEVSLFSDEVSLFRDIEGKLLTDLNFSDLNHTFNVTNVSDTWQATQGEGYVYPMMDGGDYIDRVTVVGAGSSPVFELDRFKPAIYVKEYIDRIFSAAGYQYESAFFNSARFASLAIPYYVNGLLVLANTEAGDEAARVKTTGESSGPYIEFNDDSSTGFYDNGANFNVGTHEYIVPLDGEYDIYLTAILSNDDVVERVTQAYILVNDAIVVASSYYTIPATTSFTSVVNQQIPLLAGDVLTFSFNVETGISVAANSTVRIFPATIPMAGYPMNMNNAVPVKIKQSELLTDLIKMFNLMIYADPSNPKKLFVEPWVDFYSLQAQLILNAYDIRVDADGGDAEINARGCALSALADLLGEDISVVDWSYKVDQYSTFNILAGDPESRKTYQFNFADGGDLFSRIYREEFNQGYGSRKYTVDNYYAKNTVTVDTLCAPCIAAQYNTERVVFRAFDLDNNGNAKPITTGYRIGQYKYVTPAAGSFWLFNNVWITNGYPYIGHLDDPYTPTFDLTFGMPLKVYYNALDANGETRYTNNNLFNLYWKNYVDEMVSNEAMQVELTVVLTPVDIAQLDFRKVVYIHGTYWRLLEIRDFVAGKTEPCRIVLRRVLNGLPFSGGAFTVEPGYTTTPRDGEQVPTIAPPFTTTT
jgi:hypothetical protein